MGFIFVFARGSSSSSSQEASHGGVIFVFAWGFVIVFAGGVFTGGFAGEVVNVVVFGLNECGFVFGLNVWPNISYK